MLPLPPALREIVRRALSQSGVHGRVMAAVSGGPDSTALLLILHELAPEFGLQLAVGHYDHGLRPESSADAAWTEALARARGWPVVVGRDGETAAAPSFPSTGVEARARRDRYAFLAAAAREMNAAWVATGHTADDQTETVLHHIVRGTGLAGLRGIAARRRLAPGVRLVRPLLDVRRATLLDWLRDSGQDFLRDATNDDRTFTRNLLRHDWLPRMRAELNPQVDGALCRLARHAADALRLVRRDARRLLDRSVIEWSPERVRLCSRPIAGAPAELVCEAARLLWRRQHWPRGRMSFSHWCSAAEHLAGRGPAGCDWPGGVSGRRRGSNILLSRPRAD